MFRQTVVHLGKTRSGGSYNGPEYIKKYIVDGRKTLDDFVEKNLSHQVLGFAARVALVAGVGFVCLGGAYKGFVKFEERKPIAKRWAPRWTEITLIEKVKMEEGSNVVIYRFALPNSYDSCGFTPVSSVLLKAQKSPHWYKSKKRWFTPISHPDQRGVVEFAVKLKDPGYMSGELRKLRPGSKMSMGPWVKEFRYRPNHYGELDFIVAGAGISPLLQTLSVICQDETDKTKVRLLYSNLSPETTPFFNKLMDVEKRYPEKFEVKFCADNGRWDKHPAGEWAAKKGWTGNISKDFILRWIGPPTYEVIKSDEAKEQAVQAALLASKHPQQPGHTHPEASMTETRRRRVLVSGPGPYMTYLSGRATMIPFVNYYWQGPYHGMLKELGFRKSQVYQFANPWTLSTQS